MPGLRKTLARLRDGERLVLTYTQANPLGFMYHLEPRGGTVPIAIAERIQREPGIVQGGDGLFPNTDQTWSFV